MGEPYSHETMAFDTQNLAKNVNELLVLGALRDGPMHGYQIGLEVEARSAGQFELQHGTLYPILHRLEREGLIDGKWDRESGRRRRRYQLTRAGRRHLGAEAGRLRVALEQLLAITGRHESLRARPAAG